MKKILLCLVLLTSVQANDISEETASTMITSAPFALTSHAVKGINSENDIEEIESILSDDEVEDSELENMSLTLKVRLKSITKKYPDNSVKENLSILHTSLTYWY